MKILGLLAAAEAKFLALAYPNNAICAFEGFHSRHICTTAMDAQQTYAK